MSTPIPSSRSQTTNGRCTIGQNKSWSSLSETVPRCHSVSFSETNFLKPINSVQPSCLASSTQTTPTLRPTLGVVFTVLRVPAGTFSPYMLEDKLRGPVVPAFIAADRCPSPSSPPTLIRAQSMTAGGSVQADLGSHPVSPPPYYQGRQSLSQPFERKQPLSSEDRRPRESSGVWRILPDRSSAVPYQEHRLSTDALEFPLPPKDRLQPERHWTAAPAEYQEHQEHDLRPSEPLRQKPVQRMSDSREHGEGIADTPIALDQHSDKKEVGQKRQFSRSTKTGCLTCRKRKKKCDEAKPKCQACSRGNFECAGYNDRVPRSKAKGSKAPPAIQARAASIVLRPHCIQTCTPHCRSVQTCSLKESERLHSAQVRAVDGCEPERRSP